MRSRRTVAAVATAAMILAAGAVTATPAAAKGKPGKAPRPDFTLTILHNNDGESSLTPTEVEGVEYGGIARFQRKVDTLRLRSYFDYDRGEAFRRGNVLLNSGDNYLPGPQFQASQQDGAPFYDAIAVKLLRYDALAIGNHEFDFGPATFGRFVETVDNTDFVSANLDFSGEPTLADLEGDRILDSTVIRERGKRIGVIGLTTPILPSITSPGGVEVLTDLAGITQAEVDRLTRQGVDIIIVQSHLQGIESEKELVSQLRGVDVVIGGGGSEVLADADTRLFPGQEDEIFGDYPQLATDLDGVEVPVVTTPGNYRYVGQLQVTFDRDGNVIGIDEDDSGLQIVTDSGPGAVGESLLQRRLVQDPVQDFVDGLGEQIIGSSDIVLDCDRPDVRLAESNCGNLVADAHLATAQAQAASFGLDTPQLAIQNGGGIRGEQDQPAGPISVGDTFRIQPFGNIVAIAEDVSAETLRQIFEEGVAGLPTDGTGDGAFAQVSEGTEVTFDLGRTARQVTAAAPFTQVVAGERVVDLVLPDGTVVVQDGVTQDVTVDLAALNFSLNGGDAYPPVPFTTVGVTDQQSLQNYIVGLPGSTVTAAQYPPGGEGRISIL